MLTKVKALDNNYKIKKSNKDFYTEKLYALYKINNLVWDRFAYLASIIDEIQYGLKHRVNDTNFIINLLLESSNFNEKKYKSKKSSFFKKKLKEFHRFVFQIHHLYGELLQQIQTNILLTKKNQNTTPNNIELYIKSKIVSLIEKYSPNTANLESDFINLDAFEITLKYQARNVNISNQIQDMAEKILSKKEKKIVKYVKYNSKNKAYQNYEINFLLSEFAKDFEEKLKIHFNSKSLEEKIYQSIITVVGEILPWDLTDDKENLMTVYVKKLDVLIEQLNLVFAVNAVLEKNFNKLKELFVAFIEKQEVFFEKYEDLVRFNTKSSFLKVEKVLCPGKMYFFDNEMIKNIFNKLNEILKSCDKEIDGLELPKSGLKTCINYAQKCLEILSRRCKELDVFLKSLPENNYFYKKAELYFKMLKIYSDPVKTAKNDVDDIVKKFVKKVIKFEKALNETLSQEKEIFKKLCKEMDSINQSQDVQLKQEKFLNKVKNDTVNENNYCNINDYDKLNKRKDNSFELLKEKYKEHEKSNEYKELKESKSKLQNDFVKKNHLDKVCIVKVNDSQEVLGEGLPENLRDHKPNEFIFRKNKKVHTINNNVISADTNVISADTNVDMKKLTMKELLRKIIQNIDNDNLVDLNNFCRISIDACVKKYTAEKIKEIFEKIVGDYGKVKMKDGKHMKFKFGIDFMFTLCISHGPQKSGGKYLSRMTTRTARLHFIKLKEGIELVMNPKKVLKKSNFKKI